jgi:hypothetical protein
MAKTIKRFYGPLEKMVINFYRWRTKWRNRHLVWFYRCLENMQTHYAVYNAKANGTIFFVDPHGEVFDRFHLRHASEDEADILVSKGFTKITPDDELITLIGCPADYNEEHLKPLDSLYSTDERRDNFVMSHFTLNRSKPSDDIETLMQRCLGFMFDQTDRFSVFLFEQVVGFFAWLRLVVIVFCPITTGIYSVWWISPYVPVWWGDNDVLNFIAFMVQFLIAGLSWCFGFYGVKYLLKLLRIDNRPNSD